MKRVLSFDFLRGIAIIGVVLFHVLNATFDVDGIKAAILEGEGQVAAIWWVLAPILLVVMGFNGFFLMISASSNAISVGKQWDRAMEKGISKEKAFNTILGSQIIRGAVIWLFGYISESVLGNLLGRFVEMLNGEEVENFWLNLLDGFFFWNILNTIGISLIITSFIQLITLKNEIPRKKVSVFLVIVTIACMALIPFNTEIIWGELIGNGNFSSDLLSASPGDVVLRLLLVPFFGRLCPLIPFFSSAAMGLLVSININQKNITASFLRKLLYFGLLLIASSFITGLVFGIEFGDREKHIFYQLFVFGFELMAFAFMIYMIDYRKKTRVKTFVKYTAWIRRFGIMTLTLWMLQYLMIFPVILFQGVTGWDALSGGLTDMQLGLLLLLIFFMWHLILWLWEKANFKGSFEWLTGLVLSGGRSSGDRQKTSELLYSPEKMIEHVEEGRNIDTKEKALIITNLSFAGFYALIIILVIAGVISF